MTEYLPVYFQIPGKLRHQILSNKDSGYGIDSIYFDTKLDRKEAEKLKNARALLVNEINSREYFTHMIYLKNLPGGSYSVYLPLPFDKIDEILPVQKGSEKYFLVGINWNEAKNKEKLTLEDVAISDALEQQYGFGPMFLKEKNIQANWFQDDDGTLYSPSQMEELGFQYVN